MQRLSDMDIAILISGCEAARPDVPPIPMTRAALKTALLELVELRALIACRDIGNTRVYQRPDVGTEHVMFLLGGVEYVLSKDGARDLAASIFHVLRSKA